jgi:hypothetical protein
MSIIQGPVSVAPCQYLISRFAFVFAVPHLEAHSHGAFVAQQSAEPRLHGVQRHVRDGGAHVSPRPHGEVHAHQLAPRHTNNNATGERTAGGGGGCECRTVRPGHGATEKAPDSAHVRVGRVALGTGKHSW